MKVGETICVSAKRHDDRPWSFSSISYRLIGFRATYVTRVRGHADHGFHFGCACDHTFDGDEFAHIRGFDLTDGQILLRIRTFEVEFTRRSGRVDRCTE